MHGCVHALDALLAAIEPTVNDQLVFLGDMIDRGRDTREVLDRIIEHKQRCPVVLIQGNHEELLFAAQDSEQALRYWENCGGVAMLNSYRFGGKLADIPAPHWQLLGECLPYYETDRHIFTHANYLPDMPMPLQPEYQLRWALFEPSHMQPHISGKTVLVGHTEQVQGEVVDLGFAMCIDTACWRDGWMTAIDVLANRSWQASRWGAIRDDGEATQHGRLSPLLRYSNAS